MLKKGINILIEKESDLEARDFHKEILNTGQVIFYKNESQILVECDNKKLSNPDKYNCILISGKSYPFIIIIYFFRFLENCFKIQ